MINRTAERVLSIIAVILTGIGLVASVFIALFMSAAVSEPGFQDEMRQILSGDGTFTPSEVDVMIGMVDSFYILIWIAVIAAFISLVLNIIGTIKIWNNSSPKAAGILFIVAGLFGGIISLTSILLYIAGILCFTKKPPMAPEPLQDDYAAAQSTWMN
ncbi:MULTISPECIES: DUF4064 domain-containing protein [Sporosarcina]|uniref:DUF4064 domain-containing protein n=1 Tax=Sporosarcina TaxID=1569 RepID=UPI00129ACB97|nr:MULTISPECIES: DUF4064 domain-containing protein [Sporosarcina]GKV65454.1 hypothetical protein NCCP2331_16070 [Sporosarcina sp. NCCP-2331]GLB55578.1 hypothetical protein NCCP2378_13650 [Sporosarcina sp. NCCP-2378]